jgi:hypothetical protein
MTVDDDRGRGEEVLDERPATGAVELLELDDGAVGESDHLLNGGLGVDTCSSYVLGGKKKDGEKQLKRHGFCAQQSLCVNLFLYVSLGDLKLWIESMCLCHLKQCLDSSSKVEKGPQISCQG